MKEGRKWLRLLVACLMVGSLALAGCSGDDGDPGPAGPAGADGTNGTDGIDGSDGSDGADGLPGQDGNPGTPGQDGATVLLNAHDIAQRGATVTVTNVTATEAGAVITANVKVDGVDRNDFGTVVAVASYTTTTNAALPAGKIGSYDYGSGTGTVVSNGSGNYTITVAPPALWVSNGWWTSAKPTTWMVRLNTGAGINYPEANIVANATADGQHVRKMVSNQACVNCHSTNIFKEQHASRVYHNSAYGSQSCVTCHTHAGRKNLMAYAHGIHNAHNMPEKVLSATVTKPEGVYARNNSTTDSPTTWYRTTYPTYMNNCSVCHDTAESLAAANNAPVSYDLCMSCHDSWAGFGVANTGTVAAPNYTFNGINHAAMTAATPCAACHEGTIAPATAAAMHNGQTTERAGLIWNGQDASVTEGARIAMKFDSISRVDNNLVINWSATLDGVAVNPCNATVSATAPTWQSGFSILRAYGQGDDWTNAGIGTSPGQPVSTNLSFTAVAPAVPNTVCADNVATTTIALTANEIATTLTKGVVALQGKPQITFTPAAKAIAVRAKTPTREFVVASGALPAQARRDIVDTAACLKCHVGSLYQHGGNRIDNVDMCVMCHNEASSDQSVRVFDGVSATEAYDGKAGQTYGFKSLLHAVHSAGVNGAITMIYRTNGNFVWAGKDTVIPNYPTVDWDGKPIHSGSATWIFGSSAPHGTGAATGDSGPSAEVKVGGVVTIPAGTVVPYKQVLRVHNLHVPTYPQNLKNCAACHKPGTEELPDQSKAVATTIKVGAIAPDQMAATHANYGIQTDDTLQGPAAAACTSCHQSPVVSVNAGMQAHASQNGWAPVVTDNGRADFLNYSRGVETCYFCHK